MVLGNSKEGVKMKEGWEIGTSVQTQYVVEIKALKPYISLNVLDTSDTLLVLPQHLTCQQKYLMS